MEIYEYLNSISLENKEKIEPIFEYIIKKYKFVQFSDNYAQNTKMPTFRISHNYVTIGLMKKYISIHFSNYDAVKHIKENWKEITANVGCVNIKYNLDIKYELIFEAIEKTFK